MKRIVVISSSPRKDGNSAELCKQFVKGAKEAGHDVELFYLQDFRMSPCLACEYCRSHDRQCVIKDDADTIIDKIIQSDVFVLATPIYFYSVSAQLKILMDRMFAREYEIRDGDKKRESYLILTSGAPDHESMVGAVESYRGFIRVLRTVEDKGVIYGTGAFHKGDAEKHPSFKEAYEIGQCITERI